MQTETTASGGFFDWLKGTATNVADVAVQDYLNRNFPEQTLELNPTDPVTDPAYGEAGVDLIEVQNAKFNKLMLLAGAGVLAAVLLTSVLSR